MGKDGAQGMRTIHQCGGHTFAQEEKSCVVYGMPKEAVLAGGVDRVIALNEMGAAIMEYLQKLGVSNRV